MRVEKMITLVLTEKEMKEAVACWLEEIASKHWSEELSARGTDHAFRYYDSIKNHLRNNHCYIEVSEGDFLVGIDGIFEEE